ncbi:hypothetical protein VFPBJ_05260 [Purpureocillium lilacinum]|uniref:Uncharacterized protein n=1 Tax=Purpureocillium lilacinum TaxID=33203 RepID=A0A179GP45_PURLI|nr:hypothetical protein VFPBJ_05260 [Purpureocillium lilacinum]
MPDQPTELPDVLRCNDRRPETLWNLAARISSCDFTHVICAFFLHDPFQSETFGMRSLFRQVRNTSS